jgi:hypothetical protein
MPSNTYSPSIDQGAKLQFQDNFRELAQQKQSRLENSGVVTFLPSSGKTNNLGRIGRLELEEVNTRNPNKSFGDYAIDNRQLTKRRFTRTITIDKKYDINELIKDPTSDIVKQLVNAKNRVIDRVIASAAVGAVLVGAPDVAASSISAATDGVVTISATGGMTYGVIQTVTQKFINNDLDYADFRGSVLCITGKENTDLMQEPEFINNDYISAKVVDAGKMENVGLYKTVLFAGSENGGITVASPVLVEGVSTRSCLVLAPGSIALSMEIGDMSVDKNYNKVNSMDITIDLWINAMRVEGAGVIIVTTTI